MKKLTILLLMLISISCLEVYGQGCSQCRMLSEQATDINSTTPGSNINKGILYLLVMPYLLIMFMFRSQIARVFRGLFHRA